MLGKKLKTILCLAFVTLLTVTGCNLNPSVEEPTSEEITTETSTGTSEEKSLITEPIPDNLILHKGDQMYDTYFESINGYSIDIMSELSMKDLVVINFFASWCGPCQSEFPAMEEAYREYSNDVSFIAVTVESNDTVNILKKQFKEKYDVTFELAFDKNYFWAKHIADPGTKDGYGVPQTIFVDRYGTIVEHHIGSIVSANTWKGLFAKYTGADYVPPVFGDNGGNSSSSGSTPDTSLPDLPTEKMPPSSEIEAAINDESYNFGYYNATGNDAANNWPWVLSDDASSIHPSNIEKDNTYSIINTDFEVTDIYNNVLTFDYLSSTEQSYDILYVLIDQTIVKEISGHEKEWKTAYAYVPIELGTHTLSLVYVKDEGGSAGDDTVYVKNMRFISVNDIEENMHVKRPVASGYDSKTNKYTSYMPIVFNSEDGYYHIEQTNGPLLLAELVKVSHWSSEQSVYGLVVEEKVTVDNVDYSELLTYYAQLGNNSTNGLTPVTQELMNALKVVINANGDDPSENQWLEVCYYYSPYGPSAEQLGSPIYGLCPMDPIKGSLGTNTVVNFEKVLVPRGKYVEFTAPKAGVYEFITISPYATFGAIVNKDLSVINESTYYTFEKITAEEPDENLKMYAYLDANQTVYLRVAFHFPDQTGSMNVGISYVGDTYDYLVLASDSTAFTTKDEDFNIDDPDQIISINVPVEMDSDGYYRHVRDDKTLGSYIYADLLNPSSMFFIDGKRTSLKEIVNQGGARLEWYLDENDLEKTLVEDLTDTFNKYIKEAEDSVSDDNPYGLIKVNEELAGALQRIMDYYTFYGVENSWLKLCYYYDHYGPTTK